VLGLGLRLLRSHALDLGQPHGEVWRMHPLFAVSALNYVIGYVLIGLGVLFAFAGAGAATLEAFRRALAKKGEGLMPTGAGWPWNKAIEAIRDIAKELIGHTGGPPFFMGLFLVAAGVVVISMHPL
jgi:hypothetical protein